LVGGGVDE
jgi:hypothetical protein